jgi:hypothetical protein
LTNQTPDEYNPVNAMLILPRDPAPGERFRVLVTGGRNIRKARLEVTGPSGKLESVKTITGEELPCWRIDDFTASAAGTCRASLIVDGKEVCRQEFEISRPPVSTAQGVIWKTTRSWDNATETIYSAWVNALFQGCNEQTSWPALHEVTQNKERNFLYNYLSSGEDNPESKNKVVMEPDCADNPFFLRAYFSWKLGLPFGFHICDRGYLGGSPKTGQWVTNETATTKSNPVQAFNSFIRSIMNGVHSGTARTALTTNTPIIIQWRSTVSLCAQGLFLPTRTGIRSSWLAGSRKPKVIRDCCLPLMPNPTKQLLSNGSGKEISFLIRRKWWVSPGSKHPPDPVPQRKAFANDQRRAECC